MTELPVPPAEPPAYTRADLLSLRVIQIGAIAAALIVLPNPSFELDRFLVPKELVLHITAVIAGLLALRSVRRVSMTRVDWCLIAYLAVCAASAVLATNRWLGMRAFAVSASGIVLFWTARGLRQAGLERPLLNGLALAVVIGNHLTAAGFTACVSPGPACRTIVARADCAFAIGVRSPPRIARARNVRESSTA